MDFDDFRGFIFNFFTVIGLIGLGVLILAPLLALFLSIWSFESDSFKIVLSVSMWMTTLILPALAKIGLLRLSTSMNRWSADMYQSQTNYIYERSRFKLLITNFTHKLGWGLYYLFIVLLPVVASIYSQLTGNKSIFIAFIPLFFHVTLTIISLFSSGQYVWIIIPAIASLVCILFLWFNPYFHPYKVITVYLTTGEVVLAGIVAGTGSS